MTDTDKPTALIVHGSDITAKRIQTILRTRGWNSTISIDGDKAVDEYVKMKPSMVFMGLNIPTLDGHVAALEIRESDPSARIIFVVSRSRMQKARDAAYSAGAVAVLTTPLTQSDFDQNWVLMNGPVPEAPGLADLDELYPELDEIEEKTPDSPNGTNTGDLPPLPGLPPIENLPPIPGVLPIPPLAEPKKKSRKGIIAILFLVVSGLAGGTIYLLFSN